MQLFIDSFGSFLHVKDGMFEVKVHQNGETRKSKVAPQKIKTILLSKGTSVSSEAIKLALSYNIDILFLDFDGSPLGRVWHGKLGSTTKIRKAQLVAAVTEEAQKYVKDWISRKIENQINFLKSLKKHRKSKEAFFNEKLSRLNESKEMLNTLADGNIQDIAGELRGIEGSAGRTYFETLSPLLAKEYQFAGRSHRPAKDQFNSFLNYAYGVLYSKVEKSLIIAGIDPYLGFLHRDDYNQKSMVFDFIEPYRIFAEATVFKLFSAKKVNKTHTDDVSGGKTLNKEGKILLMQAFNNYMDEEKVRYKGKNHIRSNIIQFDAHSFAASLIDKELNQKDIERYDLLGDV